MNNDIQARRTRMADALEKQFETFDRLTAELMAGQSVRRDFDDMPLTVALMRMSAQISAAIAKLDRHAEDAARHAEKTARNRGSITK